MRAAPKEAIDSAKRRYAIGLVLICFFAIGSYVALDRSMTKTDLVGQVLTQAADLRSEIHKTKMAAQGLLAEQGHSREELRAASAGVIEQASHLDHRYAALRRAMAGGSLEEDVWAWLTKPPHSLDNGISQLSRAARGVAEAVQRGEHVAHPPKILSLHGHGHGHEHHAPAHNSPTSEKPEHGHAGHAPAHKAEGAAHPAHANPSHAETAIVDPHTVIDEFIGYLRKQEKMDRDRVARIHILLLMLTLLVLVAEIFIVFRPLIGTAREEAQFAADIQRQADELGRAEKDLRETNTALIAATKAKSLFLATMSHEIRTPMNGVIGALGLLRKELSSEKQHKLCATAYKSSEALISVINDILDHTKLETGSVVLEAIEFDLNAVINEVVAIFQPTAQSKNIAIAFEPHASLPCASIGDPTRIRQVIMNLVGNAVKFTSSGSVRISTSGSELTDETCVLRVEVTDSGIGIEPSAMDRLFTSFTQLDPSIARKFGGTGLGLSICKQLVELMGGHIGANSKPGAGSTFWFEISLGLAQRSGEAPVAAQSSAIESEQPAPDGGLRFLVVEDNPVNQLLAEQLLIEAGHDVQVADNGKAALAALDQKSFDIVLMDIQMPEMDGLTATRWIRQLDEPARSLPIIAVTANTSDQDRAEYREAGVDEILPKPFTNEQFYQVIGGVRARKLHEIAAEARPTPKSLVA